MNGRTGWAPASKRAEARAVEHDRDLVGRDAHARPAVPPSASLTVIAADENAIDARSCATRAACTTGLDAAREAHPEELRHRLVEVEDDRHAGQPEGQRGEHERVGEGVDLDQRVAAPAVRARQREQRPQEELGVLEQVAADAGALVPLDVQPVDADALEDARGGVARVPQREHVHRPAARRPPPRPRGARAGPPRSRSGRPSRRGGGRGGWSRRPIVPARAGRPAGLHPDAALIPANVPRSWRPPVGPYPRSAAAPRGRARSASSARPSPSSGPAVVSSATSSRRTSTRRARTASSATSGGCSTRSSRCWCTSSSSP